MKVKEENKEKFIKAMSHLIRSIKNETDNCTRLCGLVGEKELMVLDFVGQKHNVKMSDIAENVDAPMSTITSIMDKLVDRKLLNRDHSGEDRRVINVSLTTAGKKAYNDLYNKKRKLADEVLTNLNDKEQNLVIEHLHLVASVIGKPK